MGDWKKKGNKEKGKVEEEMGKIRIEKREGGLGKGS